MMLYLYLMYIPDVLDKDEIGPISWGTDNLTTIYCGTITNSK